MKDIKYIAIIDGSRVEIEKKHRTKSQYEYSAINEATRAIKSKPVIIKVI